MDLVRTSRRQRVPHHHPSPRLQSQAICQNPTPQANGRLLGYHYLLDYAPASQRASGNQRRAVPRGNVCVREDQPSADLTRVYLFRQSLRQTAAPRLV